MASDDDARLTAAEAAAALQQRVANKMITIHTMRRRPLRLTPASVPSPFSSKKNRLPPPP
jgi:hypothetical protein